MDLQAFPLWLKQAAQFFVLQKKGEDPRGRIIFVRPKKTLKFEQLSAIMTLLRRQTPGEAVLIADDLNPKYRSLFVRERIPFVYGERTIFVPNLGLRFKDLPLFKEQKPQILNKEIHALGVKIVAGHLTNQLPEKTFRLAEMAAFLRKSAAVPSLSKLSTVVRQMTELEFIQEMGRGPKKHFAFNEKKSLWDLLTTVDTGRLFTATEAMVWPAKAPHVWGGDYALSELTDLGRPDIRTVALHRTHAKIKKESVHQEWGRGLVVQLWREDPVLFSMNGFLNPIELYLSLRKNLDDRVQIALVQLLKHFELKAPGLD